MTVVRSDFVQERIDRVLTQYRESPRLLGLVRTDLEEIAEALGAICALPAAYDILTGVGEFLTVVGKWMGFPRCHCVCTDEPVYGYKYPPDHPYATRLNVNIAGYCEEATFASCLNFGVTEICINDDETYRGMLFARAFQLLNLYDIDSLQAAARQIWGDDAYAINMGGARAAVAPGRELSALDNRQLPVAFRALPLAPGVQPHLSRATGPIAGYGAGWGGYCEGASFFCPEPFDAYFCT